MGVGRTMSSNWTIPYVASRIRVSASLGEKYMAAFLMRCLNVLSCFRTLGVYAVRLEGTQHQCTGNEVIGAVGS